MGLSQAQFATKFGFPPATLRNWEQGRARPDAPTRVLLAVIAKHPEAVEDVLRGELIRTLRGMQYPIVSQRAAA